MNIAVEQSIAAAGKTAIFAALSQTHQGLNFFYVQ